MIKPKTTIGHYYNFLPPPDHAPGDIWSHLPTHGILKTPLVYGLIITPACDLQNRKVETITYLPIVPIQHYFASNAFASEIATLANGLISGLNDSLPDLDRIDLLDRRPDPEKLGRSLKQVVNCNSAQGKQVVKDRITKSIEQLILIATGVQGVADTQCLQFIFGKKDWKILCEKLTKNSLRADLHFLPADKQDADWSAISSHSIVLFRYPLTTPIDVLDIAQDNGLGNWQVATQRLALMYPIVKAFAERPVKMLRIQNRIMADLLTRYLSLYSRIGSPDFSQETVSSYIKEFGGVE